MADFDSISHQTRLAFLAPGAPDPFEPVEGAGVFAAGYGFLACVSRSPAALANIAGPPIVAGPSTWAQLAERLIIAPPVLDAGHVITSNEVSGNIWNTYAAETATLEAIQTSGVEGIQRSGLAPGDEIGPLQGAEPTYVVTSQGPPIIAAFYTYEFDLQDCVQEVVGSRGIVIASRPLTSGYAEGRRWDTGIFESASGKESRSSRYDDFGPPKRFARLPLATVSEFEQAQLQNALRFGGRYALSVPLWFNLTTLEQDTDELPTIYCDTTDREFLAGMTAMVIKADRRAAASNADTGFAVRSIEEVQSDRLVLSSAANGFLAGDLVLPLIPTATPRGLSLDAFDHRRLKGALEFEELAQAAAAAEIPNGASQYLGFDIWEPEPRGTVQIAPDARWIARGQDWQAQSSYSPKEASFRVGFDLLLATRTEARALREWFDRKRGREGAFWVRSRTPAMTLAAAASSGSGLIEVHDALDVFGLRNVARHVWSPDLGAAFEVGNARDSATSGRALLDVNPALPGDLLAGARLEHFFLVRFADDRLDMEVGQGAATNRDGGEDHLVLSASVSLIELPKETPTNF